MANVVSLKAARELKQSKTDDEAYKAVILAMDKLELLEEMVRFQEERARVGHLTPSMMLRGKILFRALEESAETQELRLLTRSYRRHLDYELSAYLQNPNASAADEG
jgi:hypothetical protein